MENEPTSNKSSVTFNPLAFYEWPASSQFEPQFSANPIKVPTNYVDCIHPSCPLKNRAILSGKYLAY